MPFCIQGVRLMTTQFVHEMMKPLAGHQMETVHPARFPPITLAYEIHKIRSGQKIQDSRVDLSASGAF
jgi:hypothetical protein